MSVQTDTAWVAEMFPGDGWEIPSDNERDRADAVVFRWSLQWGEQSFRIARIQDGTPTNRAFLRSRLRRWWAK